jgi:hypothetical protein
MFVDTRVVKRVSAKWRNSLCLKDTFSTKWLPSQLTTYLYSVLEIEEQMRRIKGKRASITQTIQQNQTTGKPAEKGHYQIQEKYLLNKYNDWKSVLETYEGSKSPESVIKHNNKVTGEIAGIKKFIERQSKERKITDTYSIYQAQESAPSADALTVKGYVSAAAAAAAAAGGQTQIFYGVPGEYKTTDGKTLTYKEAETYLKDRRAKMKNNYGQLKEICARELDHTTPVYSDSGLDFKNECDGLTR